MIISKFSGLLVNGLEGKPVGQLLCEATRLCFK